VAAADHALGPLLETVRLAARPTLVVLTGDHGEALGDHGESTHGLFAYESTLRIPLIVSRIGGAVQTHGAEVSDLSVRHVDIVPTILDAVEVTAPADLPGQSLRRPADVEDAAGRASYFEAMSPMLDYGWAPLSGGLAARARYTEADDPKHLVDIDQKMHDAVALDEEGRTPEAIALYREILSRRSEMMAAARHLAFDYWRAGRMTEAIATLRTAM